MKNLNLLVVEGNIPIENQNFKQNGIPTHSESLKESLSYYTNDLNIDVFNPCNEKNFDKILLNIKDNNWREIMEVSFTDMELQIWSIHWTAMTALVLSLAVMLFAVWVGFRLSNGIYNSGESNIVAKIAVTVFNLCVAWFLLFWWAYMEWYTNGVANAFAELKATGTSISPNAQMHLDAGDPAAPLSILPDLVQGLFLGSILVIQLAQTWMTKK